MVVPAGLGVSPQGARRGRLLSPTYDERGASFVTVPRVGLTAESLAGSPADVLVLWVRRPEGGGPAAATANA
jgi:hypothetical protein